MNPKLKKVFGFLFIFLSVSAVVWIAFSNPEMKDAWKAFSSLKVPWMIGLLGCWLAYVLFETGGIWAYLRGEGYRISLFRVLVTELVGLYYSNITPSAAGGQPMQVNSLRKAGIPVSHGTLALTIRVVTNQFMICLIALVLYLVNRDFVYNQLQGVIWFARVGWLINFAAVPLVVLAAFRRKWIQALAEKLIRLGAKLRIVRNPEKLKEKTTETLDNYHESLMDLVHRPRQILLQLLCSGLSVLGLMGSVVFTYYAFGQSGTGWSKVLTLSFLLFVSASYTPLPGASGAQEGGFMRYFGGVFKDGTVNPALLIWRFFTYYLSLIVGAFTLIVEKILLRKGIRKDPDELTAEEGGKATEEQAHGKQPETQL